ncbi:hypothetical protein [uncultured Ruegeria sp.]|uniref:hypothetical protein n=1 Tax=uncultured Ruegeria sp. TaxID=259304 RepID=UPI002607D37B|nr:hypothetical protein [uncultured Ruegeria sp.]
MTSKIMPTKAEIQRLAENLLFIAGAAILVAIFTLSFANPTQLERAGKPETALGFEEQQTDKRDTQTVPPALQKDFLK